MALHRVLLVVAVSGGVWGLSGCQSDTPSTPPPAAPPTHSAAQASTPRSAPLQTVDVLDNSGEYLTVFGKEEDIDAAIRAAGTRGIISLSNIGSMFPVKSRTRVEVLQRNDAAGKTQVRILSGDSANEVCWVFSRWVKQASASDALPDHPPSVPADQPKTPEHMADEVQDKFQQAGYASVGPAGDDLIVSGFYVADGGKLNVGVHRRFFDAPLSQQRQWLRDFQRIWASIYRPSKDAFVEIDDDFGFGKISVTRSRIKGLPTHVPRETDASTTD